jgi:hypothetical protein
MSLAQQNLNRWNNCHIPQAKAAAFKTAADKLMSPDYRLGMKLYPRCSLPKER